MNLDEAFGSDKKFVCYDELPASLLKVAEGDMTFGMAVVLNKEHGSSYQEMLEDIVKRLILDKRHLNASLVCYLDKFGNIE